MFHNNNSKDNNTNKKKSYFCNLDYTTKVFIIAGIVAAIPITYVFIEAYWKPFNSHMDSPKMSRVNGVIPSKQNNKNNNENHSNCGYCENIRKKCLCQWKLVITNKDTNCTYHSSMNSKGDNCTTNNSELIQNKSFVKFITSYLIGSLIGFLLAVMFLIFFKKFFLSLIWKERL